MLISVDSIVQTQGNRISQTLVSEQRMKDRKHDDLWMGTMGTRPHGEQRIWATRMHAWNDLDTSDTWYPHSRGVKSLQT